MSTLWLSDELPWLEEVLEDGSILRTPRPGYVQVGTAPDGRRVIHAQAGAPAPSEQAEEIFGEGPWRWSDLHGKARALADRVLESLVELDATETDIEGKTVAVIVREKLSDRDTRPAKGQVEPRQQAALGSGSGGDSSLVDAGKRLPEVPVSKVLEDSLPPHQWLGENK